MHWHLEAEYRFRHWMACISRTYTAIVSKSGKGYGAHNRQTHTSEITNTRATPKWLVYSFWKVRKEKHNKHQSTRTPNDADGIAWVCVCMWLRCIIWMKRKFSTSNIIPNCVIETVVYTSYRPQYYHVRNKWLTLPDFVHVVVRWCCGNGFILAKNWIINEGATHTHTQSNQTPSTVLHSFIYSKLHKQRQHIIFVNI